MGKLIIAGTDASNNVALGYYTPQATDNWATSGYSIITPRIVSKVFNEGGFSLMRARYLDVERATNTYAGSNVYRLNSALFNDSPSQSGSFGIITDRMVSSINIPVASFYLTFTNLLWLKFFNLSYLDVNRGSRR